MNHTGESAAQFVDYAISIGALELLPNGRELKSGRISHYFFNSGLFYTGNAISRLAAAYAGTIGKEFKAEVIFGPSYKGSAIAVAVAQALIGRVGWAYNRKEAKTHGEKGIIIGAPLQGKKVVLVDDVMTTGESLGEAFDIVKTAEGIPIACVIAFDRQERGKEGNISAVQEFEQKYQIPVRAAATLNDLILSLEKCESDFSINMLAKIKEYKVQYGV